MHSTDDTLSRTLGILSDDPRKLVDVTDDTPTEFRARLLHRHTAQDSDPPAATAPRKNMRE
ncbi:hypothetical protein [Caenispirillum bisanense]|uniref:Uncharacterized protein n=1 Tax=Caenispirillum bisanense TaxID=414052 RepID=A0A286GNE6_9PROT|nr:hypothetical protein [Caenispirillum bisanense]SOD97040.1 hypothetical protein SAMN05421508_106220 [Caenispirillum bisanense]